MEHRLEEFDIQAMRGDGGEQHIEQLVTMRRQVGALRRALAHHRSALVARHAPRAGGAGGSRLRGTLPVVATAVESTVQEARDAREAIVGSFDVLIARTGHRTNDIMKVLTLTSVILLPGMVIAGLMGMNFRVGLFDAAWGFYVVVAVTVAIAVLVVGVAKLREWI